jgi:hypothetical protein
MSVRILSRRDFIHIFYSWYLNTAFFIYPYTSIYDSFHFFSIDETECLEETFMQSFITDSVLRAASFLVYKLVTWRQVIWSLVE